MKFEIESLDEGFVLQTRQKRCAVRSEIELIKRIVDFLHPEELKEEIKPVKEVTMATNRLDKPCQACGANEFVFTRHQGNRYGNFDIYRCDKCGMKRNVMDKKPEQKESVKEGMSERTKELQEMAKKMQAGQ
jgi:hypothetical protein